MGEPADIEAFLRRWVGQAGGAEHSNAQLFFCELCAILGVSPPEPAIRDGADEYVFERPVRLRPIEGEGVFGRIDLYKRDHFILEAKQSRASGGRNRPPGLAEGEADPQPSGRRGRRLEGRGWDKLMRNAREQAESYVDRLPPDHAAPPFLLVCDVGHVFEIYADFSGTGRSYTYFPDRQGYRLFLDELRTPSARERLRTIWSDPLSLDPARRKARVTREIAEELATVSRQLEQRGKDAGEVALFLMRCIFCMFACSVGLLPPEGMAELLDRCLENPNAFVPLLSALWRRVNDPLPEGRYYDPWNVRLPLFGGKLFQQAGVTALDAQSLAALRRAAGCSWSDVEPAIFGALLEGALDPDERRRLGAHYTPRVHVERLVRMTVMDPLRRDWQRTLTFIAKACERGKIERAQRWAVRFHAKLRAVRVLDPACGTGNFLYVALELIKALETEVLETLAELGAPELLALQVVDPSQFLGLELNPRAASIAELVLWIGYLQLHYRTSSAPPAEPILRAFDTVVHTDAVLERAEALGPWVQPEGPPQPRRPQWPKADFIVGNPPFLGGKDLRARLGDDYAEALWAAHPWMNRSADLVTYWWDHAAELLTGKGSRLRRFGFVTTNSLSQSHQRRVVERRLAGEPPIHLAFAVPDHPWTRVDRSSAAVRVAMTVAEAGPGEGVRLEVTGESGLDSDTPELQLRRARGRIHGDLSVGADLAAATPLLANRGLCSPGVKLHGAGFIVSLEEARRLGLDRRPGLEDHIRPYRNGRDIVQQGRDAWVIDLYPLSAEAVRVRFPEVYQHLLATVKPERDRNRMAFRRENWWWFGATHELYRGFTAGLERYIATPETAKHRVFVFLPGGVRADNMLVNIGLSDGFHLGVLSSRTHRAWARATGAVLEDRPRYTKSACFDPFPFPDTPAGLRRRIEAVGEELDATRATVQAEHPDLTLTTLYNAMAASDPPEDTLQRGRVPILAELHAQLDALVADAYGWPAALPGSEATERLLELNRARVREEEAGRVCWLRPDFQRPRYGGGERKAGRARPETARPVVLPVRPAFPRDPDGQPAAVLDVMRQAERPLGACEIAKRFRSARRHLEADVQDSLILLAQYGHLALLPDGRYLLRRVA